jgi:hypothetical protein
MKRILLTPLVVLCLLASPAWADDPPAPTDSSAQPADSSDDAEKIIDDATKKIDEDPGGQAGALVELAKSGRWGPFVGLAILFIVWGLRKFILKLISKNVLPWITIGLAVAASVAVGLGFGNTWWQILIDLFSAGGAGAILWSAIFKHFMKPKEA